MNAIDTRHQSARECERRLRQRVFCHRPGGRTSRPAPTAAAAPLPAPRLSHFVWNGTSLVRRFAKVKGNRAVKAAKRQRQASRRLAEARARIK